jgi:riboflavin kinase/FMN adenylyltransferase
MIYAIGAFDGFHRGHRILLETACERARAQKKNWGVITFSAHPQSLFKGDTFKLLFTHEEREALVKYFGIPKMIEIPFTRAVADMSPEDFLLSLTKYGNVSGLVAGDSFRFGKSRAGTLEVLSELCEKFGWSLNIETSYKIDGTVVSSTAIREFIIRGKVEEADKFLGYPFMIRGNVIRGDGRGRTVTGYPTANLAIKPNKIYPARGSYAALALTEEGWKASALNIGFNPTFAGIRSLRCEAHIIDYEADLYGQNLELCVIGQNRGEMKFQDASCLRLQLAEDIRKIKVTAARYIDKHREKLDKIADSLLTS